MTKKSHVGNLGKDSRPISKAMEVSDKEFDEDFLAEATRGKKPRNEDALVDQKQRKRSTQEVRKSIEAQLAQNLTAQEIDALSESDRILYRDSLLLHTTDDLDDADKDDASDLLQSVQWNFNQVSDWIADLKTRGEFLVSRNDTCWLMSHLNI